MKRLLNITSFLWFVPEEELPLGKFVLWCLSREDRLKGVRIISAIPSLCAHSHWGRRKILNLFKLEVQTLGLDGKVCHIFLMTSGMRGNEVWNELLSQALFTVYLVKYTLELLKQLERRLSHQFQHSIRGVLWSDLQSSANMIADKFTSIFPCRLVSLLVLTVMKQKVISNARAYETLLYLWQGSYGTVDIKQSRMVGVKVRTYLRITSLMILSFERQAMNFP